MLLGLRSIFVFDPACAQIFVQPTFAITAAHKGSAARFGKLGVVDIAQLGKLFDQSGNVGASPAVPPAITAFAGTLRAELGPRGRIFADIMQRQRAQTLVIQGRRWFFVGATNFHALFLPQSGRNLNWYRGLHPYHNKNVTWPRSQALGLNN